ncbi:MAG: hypothetical protein SV062_15000 [Thermodesulfobacteriota bacterium]|nr:hypothetical protein [Thermodesulfobacteriota bacterium]
MVTNDEEGSPVEIWREYRTRAKDENGIKKLRKEFGLSQFFISFYKRFPEKIDWTSKSILQT